MWGRLPPDVKEALRDIAADEHQTVSWVVERTIVMFFRLTVEYKDDGTVVWGRRAKKKR